MWELHFDVLSQKRVGSYRKSLMFKTCQAGGLTKVSTCGSAHRPAPPPPSKNQPVRTHLGGGEGASQSGASVHHSMNEALLTAAAIVRLQL